MEALLALADDLTGALEAGAKFAASGIPSRVIFAAAEGSAGVTVIDTETRHLGSEEASLIVRRLAAPQPHLVYLKTDSTLRGNIAAELRVLAAALPGSRIAYVPSYPALGRTVKGGCLFVDGIPAHQTSFASDPLNPVRTNSIADLLGNDLPCTVYDGESDADVAEAVAAALKDSRFRIIAGPASVAAELAARVDAPRRPVETWPSVKRCLVVNGSLHETSARQIAYALANGCVAQDDDAPWRVLTSGGSSSDTPLHTARATGRTVKQIIETDDPDALMVFGGDTAFGILRELGTPSLYPLGEVITGVPVSRIAGRGLHLITKAGGFGDDAMICRVRQVLNAT